MYGESWTGLNDADTEGVFVWDGTDLPYNWGPNTLSNSDNADHVKMKNDFSWNLHTDENRYILCQNMSGIALNISSLLLTGKAQLLLQQ